MSVFGTPALAAAGEGGGVASSEPRARRLQRLDPRQRRFTPLAMLVDDLFLRLGQEAFVRELGVELLRLCIVPFDLLVETLGLRAKIDDALERQRRERPAHEELGAALGRSPREGEA